MSKKDQESLVKYDTPILVSTAPNNNKGSQSKLSTSKS